jgi:mycofactocin system glycosyltransferase
MDLLMPADFRLALDRSTRVERGGRVLLGGTPFRVVRLGDDHAAALAAWRRGEPVGAGVDRRRFARALVASNLAQPGPPPSRPADRPADRPRAEVAVVVPVRDRPRQLDRLLRALARAGADPVRDVIVVDDASTDPDRTASVVAAAGGRLLRRPARGGAPAARNDGAAATTAPFVAFLDSDCVPEPGWLGMVLPHFADPLVAAVAPRVVALSAPSRSGPHRSFPGPGAGWLASYEDVRSPLDRGAAPARVLPGGQVPFVPGAALVVRSAALGGGFDETLGGGEDVDLGWRLTREGWHVRYEPAARVAHEHRVSAGAWLSRRAYYGRTAAPLARRHPAAARPLAVSPWTAAAWAAAALRRPYAAAAIVGAACALLAGRLAGVVDRPGREAVRLAGGGTLRSGLRVADAVTRTWWPAALLAAVVAPRLRLPLAGAVLAPALAEWRRLRPPLDPVRWTVARILDDAAYGWGVWAGCWAERDWGPVRPDLGWRLAIQTGDELVAATATPGPARWTTPGGG